MSTPHPLSWIPSKRESIRQDDFSARHETSGKRVGNGLHPLLDDGDAPCGTELTDDLKRLLVLHENGLPSLVRNASSLDRESVKSEVLQTYTTTAPIASFIVLDEDRLTEQERAKMRADRLGTDQKGQERSAEQNQTHLIRLIESMDSELKTLWHTGEKVKSLRIAIQASKLLSSTKVPQCYPSVFVLVATVLDTFGNFVAERLQATAAGKSCVVASLLKRGQDASVDLIPPEAIEMCYNWFLKISSIRELLPRICMELSLLKCNKFLAKKARVHNTEVVVRLAKQIRGVADPLVACHLRWYLFTRAAEVFKGGSSEWAAILEETCLDNFLTLDQLKSSYFERLWLDSDFVCRTKYLHLLCPGLQWQLDTIARFGCKATRLSFLQRACAGAMRISPINGSLLLTIMRAFPPEDWVSFGLDALLEHVDAADVSLATVSRMRLLETFALIVAEHDPSTFPMSRAKRTALLNELWSRLETHHDEACKKVTNTSITAPQATVSSVHVEFIDACCALLQYCCVHMGAKQVNVLLSVVRQTAEREGGDTGIQLSIFRLLSSLVCRTSDVRSLLVSDHFLTLLRFVDPQGRHALSRSLLQLMPPNESFAEVTLELAKTLAETFDLIGLPQDAQKACTETIVNALRLVSTDDMERQIEFMCEARHALPNIDAVKIALVHQALTMVQSIVTRSPKKRNAAKAYLAFCHVTIPAAADVFVRTRLAVQAAGIAFQFGFVAQGEALLRLAMDFMKEMVPRSSRADGTVVGHCPDILESLLQLVSIGAVTPSHAKYGHNYVLSAVLQWNGSFEWSGSSNGQVELNCAIIRCLSKILAGGRLGYGFPKCATENYVNDPDYIASAQDLCTSAAQSSMESLQTAAENPHDLSALGFAAMTLFETCVAFGDISDGAAVAVRSHTAEAWELANKFHTGTDVTYTRQLASLNRFAMKILGPEAFNKATSVSSTRSERCEAEAQLASSE